MIGKKIQKFIVKEIEIFYDEYKKSNFDGEDDHGTVEKELITKLIDHFSTDKKPMKKELSEEDRCIAITSKKTQCTSKKVENDLCKIHNTKGTNYGVIGDPVPDKETPKKEKKAKKEKEQEKPDVKNPCQHMITRGKDAGSNCNKEAPEGETLCKKHQPKKLEKIPKDSYPSEETVELESEDIIGSDIDADADVDADSDANSDDN